jgi:hypothetical protein
MTTTPYFTELQTIANSYSCFTAAKRNWITKKIGFSPSEVNRINRGTFLKPGARRICLD